MKRVSLFLPIITLAGCALGRPDSHVATELPPTPQSIVIAPVSGGMQKLEVGRQAAPDWWHAFGSQRLNTLVSAALEHNNDLAAAEASLRQARELARATASSRGPQVDAGYQAERTQVSRALSNPVADPNTYLYTLHTMQVSVSYPLDIFGAGLNRSRSARAAADVAAARLDAARMTTVANVVVSAIQHAALEAEIAATKESIKSNTELVTLLQRRKALGEVGLIDVAAQQTLLANVEASLPALERQRDHEAALIATLLGKPPGADIPALPTMEELKVPDEVPLSVPSEVVANRPDIRAADAQVRGAAADVGSAIAARLPSITISGNAGGSATHFLDMFASGNPFFALIGGIAQPLFHSGQLRHQQHAAEAALDTAKAQYRSAALQAFLDVDDALASLRTDGLAVDAAARADAAAKLTLSLTQRQMELGAVGTLALLNTSSAASQTAIQLMQARAARLTDTVALYQACGAPVGSRGM